MAQSREPSMTAPAVRTPISVVGPRYCAPYPIELQIVGRSPHSFTVKDAHGRPIFNISKISRPLGSLHHRRVLKDAGNPILTLGDKIRTVHDRWQVFMGGSTEQLLFTAKRPNIFQQNTEKLHVFLANNVKEKDWDFMVEGSWSQRSCVVNASQSSKIATLMGNGSQGDNFVVRVEANVDYAFIVALIVILDEIN